MRWITRAITLDADPRSKKIYTTRWIIKGINTAGRMTGPPPGWSQAKFISWEQAREAIKYYEKTGKSYSDYKKMKDTDTMIKQAFENIVKVTKPYPTEF